MLPSRVRSQQRRCHLCTGLSWARGAWRWKGAASLREEETCTETGTVVRRSPTPPRRQLLTPSHPTPPQLALPRLTPSQPHPTQPRPTHPPHRTPTLPHPNPTSPQPHSHSDSDSRAFKSARKRSASMGRGVVYTTHYSQLTTHCFLLPTSYFLRPTPCFLRPTSYFLRLDSYFLHPTSYFHATQSPASRSCTLDLSPW